MRINGVSVELNSPVDKKTTKLQDVRVGNKSTSLGAGCMGCKIGDSIYVDEIKKTALNVGPNMVR